MEEYRVELRRGGWYVVGFKTLLGPYLARFKADRLAEELNENRKIGEGMWKKKGDRYKY